MPVHKTDRRGRPMRSLNRANGYRTIRGSKQYPNLKTWQRRPWLRAVRRYVKQHRQDWAVKLMFEQAARSLCQLSASSPNRTGVGKVGSPKVRAATILAHIIRQGRYSPVDILLTAL